MERVSISQSPVNFTVLPWWSRCQDQGRSVLGPTPLFVPARRTDTTANGLCVCVVGTSGSVQRAWPSPPFPASQSANFLPLPLLLPLLSAYSNHHVLPPNPPSFTRFGPTLLPSFLQPGAVCLLQSVSIALSLVRESSFLSHPHPTSISPRSPVQIHVFVSK